MRLRTFLTVLSLFGLSAIVVFLLLPNREVLEQRLVLAGRQVPVWGTILGAFALGVLLAAFFIVSGLGNKALKQAMSRWSSRHRAAAEKALERGRQAEREDQLEEAIIHFRDAVDHAPDDMRCHMRLGDALRRAGRPADAALAHERARRLTPVDDEPVHALALDHLASGNLPEARRELNALIDRNPRGALGPLRRLRDLEIKVGQWAEASRAQRKLEALFGRGRRVPAADLHQGHGIRTELARVRAGAGQNRSALALLRRTLRDAPGFLPARLLLAELQAEAGDFDDARTTLGDGFQLSGEPALLEALADVDLQRERPEDAISRLRGIVASRRWPAAARLALGELYLRLEMLDEAAAPLEDLLDTEGQSPLVMQLLAQVEERRGNTRRAAALFRAVLQSPGRRVPIASCRECSTELDEWRALCPHCGAFGTITTRLSTDEISLSGPIPQAPVYPANQP